MGARGFEEGLRFCSQQEELKTKVIAGTLLFEFAWAEEKMGLG